MFGGVANALSPERPSTRAWATGAAGEVAVGRRLDALHGEGIITLHDRLVPGSRANIDHIVITRGGVWVADSKKYRGRPELRVEGGFRRPRIEKVVVAGRDRTGLVDAVLRQADLVREAVPGVPVRAALCFVEADWSLLAGSFATRGLEVLSPRKLASLIRRGNEGNLDVPSIGRFLATRFPPA
ncbi:MAG TPA: NERD domain-containing protein [Actinomycetales bacterium]|nr:NERD domain-containing protein [Actinomycetales bacterium]